jgi:CshA-type fibril repeat protein
VNETWYVLAAEPLYVPPVVDTTTPGEPATGNVLDNADLPTGTTASVTGFSVPGTDTVYPAGSTAPVVDPATGVVTGTVSVKPDGTYLFTPAPGYVGPVPTVDVLVTSSDGQSVEVPLTVTVNPVLVDASESLGVTAGTGPLTTNVLDNAVVPPGTTATVTSFSLPGSSVLYPAGPTPVTVTDPVTGKVAGTIVVEPDGDIIFTPAPGFTGQAPAVSYTMTSSDGQVSSSALAVTVLPGEDGIEVAHCFAVYRSFRCHAWWRRIRHHLVMGRIQWLAFAIPEAATFPYRYVRHDA